MLILVVNAGSSSVKLSLFALDHAAEPGAEPHGLRWERELFADESIDECLTALWTGRGAILDGPRDIEVVGHRIVHGGAELTAPTLLTPEVRNAIAHVTEYAPAHNAAAIRGVEAATRLLGNQAPQVAVFDTAFHSTLPPAAYTYAGPRAWLAQGIRRFGFHGISHQYASQRAARVLGRAPSELRIVTCHLGSGCSLAAIVAGRSVDTTMGFTPLDGIPMSRRPGALDPGILIHLLRHGGHSVDSLDRVLNDESGLAGLSGTSGDMREVLARVERSDAASALALDVYVHRIRQGIAAMAASMNGVDAIVFTAGVGEHSPAVRRLLCDGVSFLGLALDQTRNLGVDGDEIISADESIVRVLVVRARENWMVANDALRVIA
jgi:acetate kinase